ncbi:MAG: glycosyltransferase family 39 protein [Candidatus Heimdallarchaeota archaeon]|nr:glycosyltransferase family 39 protein [Candidatus Heimdallarchaeota archaeon]
MEFSEKIKLTALYIFVSIFYIFSLSKYPLSYGVDGPYYDIQIINILETGLPESNDPPLVYYYLTIFALIFGISWGIKIGMVLVGAAIILPTYYIIKTLLQHSEYSEELSFLASFLISINIYALRLIEDFMQNFMGVFFYLMFFYFSAKTLNQPTRKNIGLTTLIFILSILTHLYTAMLTLASLLVLFLAFILQQVYVEKKNIKNELKIFGLFLLVSAIIISLIALIIPSTFGTFSKVTSFIQSLGSDEPSTLSIVVFLNISFLGSIFLITRKLLRYIKTSNTISPEQYYLLVNVISIAAILIVLTLPLVPANWATRFVLLAYIPLTLVTIIGFAEFIHLRHAKNTTITSKKMVYGIIVLLILINLVSGILFMRTMGPVITTEQYDELIEINSLIPTEIDADGVLIIGASNLHYWSQVIFDIEIVSGPGVDIRLYADRAIYVLESVLDVDSPFSPQFRPTWNILLPFSLYNPSTQNGPPRNGPPAGGQQQPGLPPFGSTTVFTGTYYKVIELPPPQI